MKETTNTLQPVERGASLGDRVYESLGANLGVSSTPVREALARLASEGLVEAHGRSLTVPSLTRADLDDIYDLRVLLETEAVRQAAARAGDPREVKLALEEAQGAHARGDAEGFIGANRRFRAAWVALACNRRLVRRVELYADHVRALQFLTLGNRERQKVVPRGMRDILGALERRDPEGAAESR